MEFIVGIALALLVCCAAAWLGMDRVRVFYPSLIVSATYYVLFAVIDGGNGVVLSEIAIAGADVRFCFLPLNSDLTPPFNVRPPCTPAPAA